MKRIIFVSVFMFMFTVAHADLYVGMENSFMSRSSYDCANISHVILKYVYHINPKLSLGFVYIPLSIDYYSTKNSRYNCERSKVTVDANIKENLSIGIELGPESYTDNRRVEGNNHLGSHNHYFKTKAKVMYKLF
jgi:hypothetical protein